MAIAIEDLRFIQTYNGRGTRLAGGALISVSLLFAGASYDLSDNTDIGEKAISALLGITLGVPGILTKGRRYSMQQWEVVP